MELQMTASTEHLAFDSNLKQKCCKVDSLMWKLVVVLSLCVSVIAVVIGVVAVTNVNKIEQAKQAAILSPPIPPQSCRNISGPSGLYTIQPDTRAQSFQVYCDMETDGGGWTLVAAVHENNIDGKCTIGDRWSSEQGLSKQSDSRSWENKNIFGQIETITDQDYKNPAYYSLRADNIMIWHVPNEKKAYEISDAAKFKYYTYNGFLNQSTLRSLYANKLPLQQAVGGLTPLINGINLTATDITGAIPFWHNYRYDGGLGSLSMIRDGGGDMYDGGNKVYFATDRENFTRLVYNTPYFLYGSGIEVKSSTIRPFIVVAWVGSGLGKVKSNIRYFDLKVLSNYGADGRGSSSTYENTFLKMGEMTAMYTAFNVANASDPSVCEVYFFIANKKWHSRSPQQIKKVIWTNQTRTGHNTVRFTGSPSNVIVGYTLLSKTQGRTVQSSEVETVLKRYMEVADNFTFTVDVPHKVVPVKYERGDNNLILSGIPTVHRKHVEPGYIQFRAFNSVGLPNALCPGIRVNSDNPEQMCIGGSSTASRDLSQCGDFAGWGGMRDDRGSQHSPSKTGKSLDDINSSILIFTR